MITDFISNFIASGFEQLSEVFTDLYGQSHLFDGLSWETLWSWMGLPDDLYTHILLLFSLFAVFVVVGFVRKLIIIFG